MSLAPTVNTAISEGYFGLADLAQRLESHGCATRRGGKWTPVVAGKLCRRLVVLGLIEHPKARGRYLPRNYPRRLSRR